MADSYKANIVVGECDVPFIPVPLDRYEELVVSETKLKAIERLYLSGESPTLTEILAVIDSFYGNKEIERIKKQEEEQIREWSKDHADPDADL